MQLVGSQKQSNWKRLCHATSTSISKPRVRGFTATSRLKASSFSRSSRLFRSICTSFIVVSSLSKNREAEEASKSSVKSRAFSAKAETRDFSDEVKSVIVIAVASLMSMQLYRPRLCTMIGALFKIRQHPGTLLHRQPTHVINEHNAHNKSETISCRHCNHW